MGDDNCKAWLEWLLVTKLGCGHYDKECQFKRDLNGSKAVKFIRYIGNDMVVDGTWQNLEVTGYPQWFVIVRRQTRAVGNMRQSCFSNRDVQGDQYK